MPAKSLASIRSSCRPRAGGGAFSLAFSLGALVPLLSYLLGLSALAATLGITAVALIAEGMVVGRLTGQPLLRSGLRQLVLGGVVGGVTVAVGSHVTR